ncbi:MAG: hypothetical protein D6698_04950 [Gammaproteobacteria bacterium]|nr:MAG: hypothetical protein D6698_04950 [Gammaproteobacteria bacterium]
MSARSDLPWVEVMYRDTLSSYGGVLKQLLDISHVVDYPQVVCPGDIVFDRLLKIVGSFKSSLGEFHLTYLTLLASRLSFCLAYRRTRQTYRVESELWEEFKKMGWPADAPTELLLHLPRIAFALEAEDKVWGIFFDRVHRDTGTDLELRILQFCRHARFPSLRDYDMKDIDVPYIIPLKGKLNDAFRSLFKPMMEGLSSDTIDSVEKLIQDDLRPVINALLYLCSGDDLTRVSSSKTIYKRHRIPSVIKEAEKPHVVDSVGVRFSTFVRKSRSGGQRETVPTGRTVSPHMRRAHWHLYWTGPGRKTPVLRFVKATSVKGGKNIIPTVTRVHRQPENPDTQGSISTKN